MENAGSEAKAASLVFVRKDFANPPDFVNGAKLRSDPADVKRRGCSETSGLQNDA